jgi:hypothetical protein
MKKRNIVVLGNEQAELLRNLNEFHSYNIEFVSNCEEVIELFQQRPGDIVLVDSASETKDIRKLQAILPIFHHEVAIMPFSGESLEELDARISEVYRRKKLERIHRLLILDSTSHHPFTGLPVFSAN